MDEFVFEPLPLIEDVIDDVEKLDEKVDDLVEKTDAIEQNATNPEPNI